MQDENKNIQNFTINYGNGYHAPIEFNGLFDGIRVDTLQGFNVLRASDDGSKIYTEGSNGTGADFAFAYTAQKWNNDDGTENYTVEHPSWVTSIKVNDSFRTNSSVDPGCEMLLFTCEPLPTGTKGRAAKLWIYGKGVTSDIPIILFQGDAKLSDGIYSVYSFAEVVPVRKYNVAGQPVGANYHGIVIANGKKSVQ